MRLLLVSGLCVPRGPPYSWSRGGRRLPEAFPKPLMLLTAAVGKSLMKSLDVKWDQGCFGLQWWRGAWSQGSVTVTKVGPFLTAEARESPDTRTT